MRLVVFGLSMSSAWGNAHAPVWRSLCRALHALGHHVVFFERDVPFYAGHRDLEAPDYCDLVLYRHWVDALPAATRALANADVGLVTSYCPDLALANDLIGSSRAPIRAFYDLDTPITLQRLEAGETIDYLGPRGFSDYDVVLSITGGAALEALRNLGARRAVALYGAADPELHRPVAPAKAYRGELSYLGAYASDRTESLRRLFLEPASLMPECRFVLGGSFYPADFPWAENVWYVHHVPPEHHSQFYCSSVLNLNVTRASARQAGYCPSARLFEAAACGAPVVTEPWEGLDVFFEPGREILVAESGQAVVDALRLPRGELSRIGAAARARALSEHTAIRRAQELVAHLCLTASESRIRTGQARQSAPVGRH